MSKKLSIISIAIALVLGIGTSASAANPGLVAATGQVNPFAGGFTVQIYNYDTSYTWVVSSNAGTATVNAIGTVTVNGLGNAPAILTITTSKSGYDNGVRTISASGIAQKVDITPYLSKYSQSANGFIIQISNYSTQYMWGVSTSAGTATLSDNGLITVSNLKKGQRATITVNTFKPFYDSTSSSIDWSSIAPPSNISPQLGHLSFSSGNAFILPILNYDDYFDWNVDCGGIGKFVVNSQGNILATDFDPTKTAQCVVTASLNGTMSGSASFIGYSSAAALVLKPLFGEASPTKVGFNVPITNFDPSYKWDASVNGGNAFIDENGLATVTGLRQGGTATLTVGASVAGFTPTKAAVTSSSFPSNGLVPSFSEVNGTNDGFTVQLSNYNRYFDYGLESTDGLVSMDASGLITVTGLSLGAAASVTVYTSKGSEDGDQASIDGKALITIVFSKPTKPTKAPAAAAPSKSAPKTPAKSSKKQVAPVKGVISVGGSSGPAVKTIICTNGSAHRFVTSTNPMCPSGYSKA
jgi:titin